MLPVSLDKYSGNSRDKVVSDEYPPLSSLFLSC